MVRSLAKVCAATRSLTRPKINCYGFSDGKSSAYSLTLVRGGKSYGFLDATYFSSIVRHNYKINLELISSIKSKTKKGLTHSLGSKRISELLDGIGIYEDLNLWFHKDEGGRMGLLVPGWTLRYLKGNSKELLDFKTIITGNYSSQLDKWTLTLYAEKIENNKRTKEFLIETGLPILRNWFESKKTETWYEGSRYFQIGLNNGHTNYCILETQNDGVIDKSVRIITVPNN